MSIDEIRARHAAAIPGPYRWGGNTDTHDIALETVLRPGGVCEILGTRAKDRSADDGDVDRMVAERARVSRPAAPRGLTTIDIQDRLRSRSDDNNTPGGTA